MHFSPLLILGAATSCCDSLDSEFFSAAKSQSRLTVQVFLSMNVRTVEWCRIWHSTAPAVPAATNFDRRELVGNDMKVTVESATADDSQTKNEVQMAPRAKGSKNTRLLPRQYIRMQVLHRRIVASSSDERPLHPCTSTCRHLRSSGGRHAIQTQDSAPSFFDQETVPL